MVNKIIVIVDIDNFHTQNIETLLFASILEKKVSKLHVLDFNCYENGGLLPNLNNWAKNGELATVQLFSNTLYQICLQAPQDSNKLLNLAKSLSNASDTLIINTNNQCYEFNSVFYQLATDIVIFADMDKDVSTNIINLFLKHSIKNKKIHIVVHNYKENIQGHKAYLHLLKSFHSPNIDISMIDKIPSMKSLKEIENIDPWLEIYKKINSTF